MNSTEALYEKVKTAVPHAALGGPVYRFDLTPVERHLLLAALAERLAIIEVLDDQKNASGKIGAET